MEKLNNFFNIPLWHMADHSITVGQVIFVPLLFFVAFFAALWVGKILTKRLAARNVSPDLIHLVRRVYLIAVLAISAVTVLEFLNVPLTAFAFISGAVAIGIGFGAQNIINNFISGWILMWERPIRIGDFLEVGETQGVVEAINTRSTRIKRVDGVHLLIPNSYLLENIVVNWTLIDRLARTTVRVGIAYGSPVRRAEELIYQAIREHANILSEPKPNVVFDSFGDNSLEFEAYFWAMAAGERDLRSIRSDVRFRIDELFREEDIVIAFPQRDVHISSLSPIDIRIVEGASDKQ